MYRVSSEELKDFIKDHKTDYPSEKLSDIIPIACNYAVGKYRTKKGIIYIINRIFEFPVSTYTSLDIHFKTLKSINEKRETYIVLSPSKPNDKWKNHIIIC